MLQVCSTCLCRCRIKATVSLHSALVGASSALTLTLRCNSSRSELACVGIFETVQLLFLGSYFRLHLSLLAQQILNHRLKLANVLVVSLGAVSSVTKVFLRGY